MIDLHMHTTYSDGTDTLKQILRNADKAHLEVISITDHNTLDAYEEMEKIDIPSLFRGSIIVGCEFTTSFDNKLIEVLGYGFDYKKVNDYLKQKYNHEFLKYKNQFLGEKLTKILLDNNFILNLHNCIVDMGDYEYYSFKKIYDEVKRHKENELLEDYNLFESYSVFIRKGLYNVNSKLYINYEAFHFSLEEVLNLIHDNGGIALLAHPFQYRLDKAKEFINKIYNENNLDGIECYYTSFTEEQINYLLSFAKSRDLLISGGSDYHGTNKTNYNLGVGNGNLNIKRKILSNWPVKEFKGIK